MGIAEQFIRGQQIASVAQYRRRVYYLAATYAGIVITATSAILLIIIWGKFFITLSQRSNVETLTLAFILVLFAYLTIVSLPGTWGAIKILRYNLPKWLGRETSTVEARKQSALKPRGGKPDAVYLNCMIRRQNSFDAPLSIPLNDSAGSLGTIVIDGARMTHEQSPCHSSNNLLAYFEQRIRQLVNARDPQSQIEIVQWASINEESALQFEGLVAFSRNLEKHLNSPPLWPLAELTDRDIEVLTREGTQLCPSLRDESHLPDVEYEAKHQLPIIPEPLAFISLSREEQRADPMVSMGCALVVTLVILGFVVLFIWLPPWVPSK